MARKRLARLGVTLATLGLTTLGVQAETLMVYWNAGHAYDTYKKVIAQFEKDNPGWTVQWERYQWPDLRAKLVADFAVGNTPDLVEEPGGWVQEFGQSGLLTPLNSYIAKDGKAMGYPSDWQSYTVSRNMVGKTYYGVQVHLTCATLLYNKDMLKAAGFDAPPTNWAQFKKIADATSGHGKFGFAPNPDIGYYWPWIYQNGGDYYDPKTNKVLFDSPAAVEAIQFISDLVHKDHAAPVPVVGADYEGPQKLFTAGRAAMIITGPWDVGPIKTGNPKLNWAIAPSLTQKVQATMAGGTSLMIPKASKHPDMAWKLLRRLVSLKAEISASLAHGMTMPRKSWAADPKVKADPVLDKFGACLSYAHDMDAELRLTGKSAKVNDLLVTALSQIMYNNAPVKKTLTDYAQRADEVLAAK